PFALAVSVLKARISQLPQEDQDDLWELFPVIVSGSAEEQAAACVAMQEILDQTPHKVQRLIVSEQPGRELDSWISFVSKRIREARMAANLTQEKVAELSGIPQSHISRLEKGQHSPTAKTLEKLAKAIGVPISQFDPSAR